MPFESEINLGKDCHLYRNTGTHATPVWVLMEAAKDVQITPFTKGKVEAKDRASKWNFKKGSFIELGLSFQMDRYSMTADDFDELLDSFLNGTPIEFFAADGLAATPDTAGVRGIMEVFEMPINQELEGVHMFDVSAEITRASEGGSIVEPDYYVVPTP